MKDGPAAPDGGIGLERVTKVFDERVVAVADVDLVIREGEFFSLLGPSGCGKTTTLRMIAGFEEPTRGRIRLRGRDVTAVPAHRRDIGMVFQSYALFPHRTVSENVAFGLRMRKVAKPDIRRRVGEALRLVALEGLEERRPAQLSGGQQQRVALARAIVIEPAVLLCDEPLGALDKQLRKQMQFELKQLQRKIGVTLVYVTHDQEEALAMSDRIAVMDAGRISQVGPPLEIYNRPATRFVSEFIGDINLFEGTLARDGAALVLGTPEGLRLRVAGDAPAGPGAIALRPEKLHLVGAEEAVENRVGGTVQGLNFLGEAMLYQLDVGARRPVLVLEPNDGKRPVRRIGERVEVGWAAADAVVLRE